MDTWRYYELTHSQHDVMNPSRPERLVELGAAIGLEPGQRVLDLGCGHAEMLLQWRSHYGIRGVGVDASPYHSARAKARIEAAGAADELSLIVGKGEAYEVEEPFDVACCIGASWMFGGTKETLAALRERVVEGGAVVTGEPYWKAPPPAEVLAAEAGLEEVLSLGECTEAGRELGLELIWMARSSDEDWDRYEMLQAAAVDAFAREHPEDPDLEALRARRRASDAAYLRWGHACLGWALWAWRR